MTPPSSPVSVRPTTSNETEKEFELTKQGIADVGDIGRAAVRPTRVTPYTGLYDADRQHGMENLVAHSASVV